VVSLEEFHRTLVNVMPEAEALVTVGTTQIAIAYDLSDDALIRDLGPMPKTTLEDGIRETVRVFRDLLAKGRLDASELDAPKAVVKKIDEV
jgi:hypothetical protein